MFNAVDKKNVGNNALIYMQENPEFTDLLHGILQANPEFSDEEVVGTMCQRYNFDPKIDIPLQYHEYFIPLDDFGITRTCKQFVLGRVHQLRPYYIQTSKYITLTLPDHVWSDGWTFSLAMNDLFIYCAATAKRTCKEKNYIPIRIVLDKKDLVFFDKGISEELNEMDLRRFERRRTERKFDRKREGLFPVDGKNPNKTVVLARELCQLTKILNLTMYQSIDFPTLIFIDYSPRNVLENNPKFNKISVT